MKRVYAIVLAMLFSVALFAKGIQRPTSYYYQRGVEAIENGENEEGIRYLGKEIQDNPKNGYAYLWLSAGNFSLDNKGAALNSIMSAIKYIPKKDKYYLSWSYKIRAIINLSLEDTTAALSDYTMAIKLDPTVSDYYEQRADVYFEQEKYELADADYLQMIKLEPGNTMGYMGHGRNLKEQKRYDEAIEVFNYVIKMEPEYSSGYSFRGECYLYQKKYSEAITDFIKAIQLGDDRKALYHLIHLENEAMPILMTKINVEISKSPNQPDWYYYAGTIYEDHKNYRSAIEMYKKAQVLDPDSWYDGHISTCYESLGDYAHAVKYAKAFFESDTTNAYAANIVSDQYEHMDSVAQAIYWESKAISLNPEEGYFYYGRGWIKDKAGMKEEAILDYDTAIIIKPNYAYAHLCRGHLLYKQGKKDQAQADFLRTIELEPEPVKNACAMYAHFYLGDTAKAIAFMDSVIARFDEGEYDAACLYSLMGDTTQSLSYLRTTLEKGFRRFPHLLKDDDLENLRQTQGFKNLYQEYWTIYQNELLFDTAKVELMTQESVYEIPYSNANGVTKVDCKINDLPLNFVFDTGASDVTLSQVEANFMFKNGYLNSKDVIGSNRYQTADGSITEGTVVNLRTINFGGCTLTNVRASVVKSQKAPLLLGQSVLQRLGKIEIDNENRIIKITSK